MRRASDAYELEVVEPRGVRRAVRTIATLAASAATWGGGPANPGGRTVVVTERATGRAVATWPERYGDDGNSLVDSIHADLEHLDDGDFERRWVTGAGQGPVRP